MGDDSRRRFRKGGLSRWASGDRAEAHDLRTENRKAGLVLIADAPDREPVVIGGTVKTLTLRPRGGVPALEGELYDGSGSITILWLGRRRIAGIFPGRVMRVEGRIGVHGGERIMFNPRYELRG